MKKTIAVLLSSAVMLALATSAQAQGKAKVLRIASTNSQLPTYQGTKKFAEIVNAKLAGRYELQVFGDNQLGDDVRATESTRMGVIDLVATSSSPLVGLVPQLMALDLPFLFPNEKAADYVVDGEIGGKLGAALEKQGLKLLAFYENGYRHLTNSVREVKSPADVKGLKVRTMENQIHLAAWKAIGANPTPMPFSEVFTALQQKTIDGQENPLAAITGAKFYEVQKYLTLTGHVWGPHVFLMNKKLWDSFSADDQKVIAAAAKESALFERALNRKSNGGYLEDLKKAGTVVTALTPEQLKAFQAAVDPVYRQFEEKIGKDFVAEVKVQIEKSQKP
jgi:TRAP-type transport system periplasmic protein